MYFLIIISNLNFTNFIIKKYMFIQNVVDMVIVDNGQMMVDDTNEYKVKNKIKK